MNAELKSCPFCGEPAQIFQNAMGKYVACDHCGCRTVCSDNEELVADAWNNRILEGVLTARIKELEKRIMIAKDLLYDEMGEWVSVSAVYLPKHLQALKQIYDALDEED